MWNIYWLHDELLSNIQGLLRGMNLLDASVAGDELQMGWKKSHPSLR